MWIGVLNECVKVHSISYVYYVTRKVWIKVKNEVISTDKGTSCPSMNDLVCIGVRNNCVNWIVVYMCIFYDWIGVDKGKTLVV